MSPPGVDLEIDPAAVTYDEDGANPSETSINIVATTRNLGSEIARSAFFNHASAIHAAPAAERIGHFGAEQHGNSIWVRFPSSEAFTTNSNRCFCYSGELNLYL